MSSIADSAPIVDWTTLGQVILYSLLAGVGVTLCFSLAIVGVTRGAEARRGGQGGSAAAYATLAVLGLAATIGAAVLAIVVMTTKA